MSVKLFALTIFMCCHAQGNCDGSGDKKERGYVTALEERLRVNVQDYATYTAKWLEGLNDKYLGGSELGRLMNYNEIKPKLDVAGSQGRGMKKMSMGMMPLIFHVGATSTWMLITTLMAAKSVAIGIALLVFKIAVSSAKVASFFTALKGKQADHHHHDWTWTPHYEHHGYERSLSAIGAAAGHEWQPYSPEWAGDAPQYRSAPLEAGAAPREPAGPRCVTLVVTSLS